MNIEFRPAKSDEYKTVANLMYGSGAPIYDFLHKTSRNDAIDFIEYEYQLGTGFCGSRVITVAVLDGTVVGSIIGYNAERYKELTGETVRNVIAFHKFRSLKVLLKCKAYAKSRTPPLANEMYLSNLCINPDFRSKGIGTKLLQFKSDEAKKNGYQKICSNVLTANTMAQKLYWGIGFEDKSESPLDADGFSLRTKRIEWDLSE